MEELTGFGMKNNLTLPLANKYFISLRDENDEPIYTYIDEFIRYFVRQIITRGRCSALNLYYKASISGDVINFSKELNVNGKLCKILDEKFE